MSDRQNVPTEIELLRRVASAGRWAIDANGDDVVGKDGRSRVGLNWVMANGALNQALKDLQEHFAVSDCFDDRRKEAADMEAMMRPKKASPHRTDEKRSAHG